MFEPSHKPRLFGLPCGVNFAEAIREGLLTHFGSDDPETLARIQIYVNTTRMKNSIHNAFMDGPTRFLPRLHLVTDLARDPRFAGETLPDSPLKLRLELARLIKQFLDQQPDFADRSSVYGLADGLANLLGEMHDEKVSYADLADLDVRNISDHWGRALEFIGLVKRYYDEAEGTAPVAEARLRRIVERLETEWRMTPPEHPILVIGSTGSRGTTAQFMDMVARLPQGAVIYPGVDFKMPDDVWARIGDDALRDHPQERLIRTARRLGLSRADVEPFAKTPPPCPPRNALLSLALRPAPVTDQWMRDGPKLSGIEDACAGLTLIEAPDSRTEAVSISLALRAAAEEGKRAALITPDRDLARQVSASLLRWAIVPEDSAGVPLNQTAPGRLLRHITNLAGRAISASDLLVLLKHPLVANAPLPATDDATAKQTRRGDHLLLTRSLELFLRRNQANTVTTRVLETWAARARTELEQAEAQTWIDWMSSLLLGERALDLAPMSKHLDRLDAVANGLSRGPWGIETDILWHDLDGRAARVHIERLRDAAEVGGDMTAREFEDFFRTTLSRELSRDPTPKHPDVLIWGTLEARSLDADLVVLGGLNDGVWPQHPSADPWFNRELRVQAGLTSPDQLIGLSAHDFEQAFCAREVVLSRAIRDAEAETVPSRWLVRVLNLLDGATDVTKRERKAMSERGKHWLDLARALDHPDRLDTALRPATRPSPVPPRSAQPKELSVTTIETLIRDPYTVYAKYVLGLRKLSPLRFLGEPKDRGTLFHNVMEQFLQDIPKVMTPDEATERLMGALDTVLATSTIPEVYKVLWRSNFAAFARGLGVAEVERLANADEIFAERKGALTLDDLAVKITAKADRIDRAHDGTHIIYDYKGSVPSKKQIGLYNLQLHFEALILQKGSFSDIGQGQTSHAAYLGLSKDLKTESFDVDGALVAKTEKDLIDLLAAYLSGRTGYTSMRAAEKENWVGDYQHLSRFGEWSLSELPVKEKLT